MKDSTILVLGIFIMLLLFGAKFLIASSDLSFWTKYILIG